MNRYLKPDEVAPYIEANRATFIDDPSEVPITELFEPIKNEWPLKLYTSKHRILRHLGSESLNILELASGISPLGMYMASLGHEVTVSDTNDFSLEWQEKAINRMGFDTMHVKEIDALTLDADQQYDVVMANMVLHFFDEETAPIVIGNVSRAAKLGGLAAVSAYTIDNPLHELEPPRNLAKLYDGHKEVESLFDEYEWQAVDFAEGMLSQPVIHTVNDKSLLLLPSVTEVIMRKTGQPLPTWAVASPDFSNIDDANRYSD